MPGYPIRTSSDPCSVDSSPRHIAASHVLHRLSMPRHPPCALKHLQTQKPKFFSKLHKRTRHPQGQRIPLMLATTIQLPNTTPHHQARRQHRPLIWPRVLSQDPIVCRRFCSPQRKKICCCAPGRRHYSARPLTARARPDASTLFVVLLRKEVIQPHLPVRLPCYDFVPIADPTFDSSPHKG